MPEPLDYRNPKSSSNAPRRTFPKPGEPAAQVVIPVRFDRLLTRTDDHPAVHAIETALRKEKVEFHTLSDGERAKRQVQIYVASHDFERAAQLAATIFVRRAKVRKIPRPEMPDTGPDRGSWIDPTFFS